MEDMKRNKFVRLANNRMNNLLNKINLIGNLADKRYYNYEQEDVNKIFKTIDAEIKTMKQRFNKQVNGNSNKFNIEN